MNEKERHEAVKALLAIRILPMLKAQQRKTNLIMMAQITGLVLLAIIIALITASRFIYG